VQDDARQYLFWMQRFSEPALFPGDLIADYFQSVTPLGYVGLYRLGTAVGLDPFAFNKLLPPVLALVTTAYLFWLTLDILPVPFTGFVSTLLLNQTLWMKDDVVSATPRAFVYPLFAAFLYYWVQHRAYPKRSPLWSTLGSTLKLLLLGLFYPQYVLVVSGILGLQLLSFGPHTQFRRIALRDAIFCGVGLAVAVVVMGYYGLTASAYGPTITAEQARQLPEFWPGGRNFFFSPNLWWFYFLGDRSGLLHVGLVRPATLCLGLFLPLLLWRHVSPIQRMQRGILWRIWLAGLLWFLAAHLLLFRLHLPSRYMDHTWRFVMAIAAAMVITAAVDGLLRCRIRLAAWGGLSLVAALLLAYPAFVENFPLTKYKVGRTPQIYQFLREQPTDSRVASLAEEADNIPAFAARSIIVGREYAIPYHLGYYRPFRERAIALTQAQYTPQLSQLQDTIFQYEIDFWLLDRKAYDPDYLERNWVNQYRADLEVALRPFEAGTTPALALAVPRCRIMAEGRLQIIDARCILAQSE
ncbi:MAG: hypothetical protein WBA10_11965, partial [Elainellaceae cyanobacterium]